MRVLDVLTSPWVILPEMLQTICEVYNRHARGELADLKAIEAATGKTLNNEPTPYTVQDGVAVVPVEGVISKRASLFHDISGGVSTQLLQRDLQAALDDPAVHSIVLAIDSPGGSVDGTQAVAQFVRKAREQKPIVALADGQMCSGAYWLGSAANQVFITGDTTMVGSIGVVLAHTDRSERDRMMGVKVSEITAGKYKRIASEHAPLTPDGAATLQDVVDHIYSVFVDEVAANRSTDSETVLQEMANGRVFFGQKSIAAGLADGVSSLPAVIAMLNEPGTRAKFGAPAPKSKGANTMEKVIVCGVECSTQEEVTAAVAAAIAKELETQASATQTATAEAITAAATAAATAERERIMAVEANAMPGHEKLVAEMKADGKTTGPEAAQRILGAEKAKTAQIAADLKADAPPPAPGSEGTQAPAEKAADAPRKIAAAAQDYVDTEGKHGRVVSYSQAVTHVMEQQAK